MSTWWSWCDRRVGLGLALLGVGHLGLLLTVWLGLSPAWMLVSWGGAFAGLLVVASRLEKIAVVSAGLVLLVAALLRLLLLPLPPVLSDDVLRYLWDGKVLAAGFDPWQLPPESEELRDLRDARWEALPHKDVPTVYPPIAQGLFSIAARLPGSLYVLKTILALVDWIACGLLVLLAQRCGLPVARTVWFAWNPLVIMETAGMGHVDTVAVTASIAAVLWLVPGRRRVGRAAAVAGVGVLAKGIPVIAAPLWARSSRRPLRFATIVGLVTAAGLLPLAIAAGGVPSGLVRYAVSWEFNGPLFEPLWRLLELVRAPDAVAWLLDAVKRATGWHDALNPLYAYRYPQFLAKLILWAVLGLAVLGTLRERDTLVATGRLYAWFLLCSATLYPWYLLWVLPWAALCRQRAWLALSASIQLCYLPQLLGQPLFPAYYLLIWSPFFLLLARFPRWSTD